MEIYFYIYKFILFSILLTAAVYDLRKRIIPNWLIIAGLIGGVLMNVSRACVFESAIAADIMKNMALGMLAGGLPLLLAELFSRIISKKQGVGGGDIKLYAVCGIFLGFELTVNSYLILSVISLAVIGTMALFKKVKKGDYIPFGPIISLAVLVTILAGNSFY